MTVLLLGSISVARSQSAPLALRKFPGWLRVVVYCFVLSSEIKAIKEGIFNGERYSKDQFPLPYTLDREFDNAQA